MKENLLPVIPLDLLEELEKRFPPRNPSPEWPDRKIYFEAGKVEVIQFLRSQYEVQQELILEQNILKG